jgi:uncharacterized delta-60 repeat protein
MVARLNTDGTLDTGLDVTGSVSLDVNGFDDVLEGVDIAPDGKIVAAGAANDGLSENVLVLRLDAAGQPDLTFSGDGIFSADLELGTTDYAMDCEVYADGYIIVAGYVIPGGNSNGYLFRLRETGVFDGTFGISGRASYDPSIGNTDRFSQVKLLADGSILAGGYTNLPVTGNDYLVVKVDYKGDQDPIFNGGTATFDMGGSVSDPMRSMALQADGKILVGGYSSNKSTIIRINHDLPVAVNPAQQSGLDLTAWPMPFGSSFQVQLGPEVKGTVQWQLLSMTGMQVVSGSETQPSSTLQIEVGETLPTGIYLLRIQSEGQTWSQQVMHQR